ncbi:MAG: ankyrin repeat domain-containing protein [Polymorphobacter sp.]
MSIIWRRAIVALMLAGLAAPAAAQFSDSYVFLKAVTDKDSTKARELLDKPGTTVVNTRDRTTGETALILVTKRGDLPWMGFLLQAGADVNLRDNAGNSPILLASISGFTEGVRVLLIVKAKVDQQNNLGETALIKAVQVRDVAIATMLLEAGANPDLADHASGYSARQYAAQDPRGGAIAKLLKEAPSRKIAPQQQGPSQ